MDKLKQYRQAVQQILTQEATKDAENDEIESQLVFDTERDRYLLLDVGWQDLKRVYHCFIHIDIKEEKIWLQRNMTETDLAQALVSLGIPKEDIILGLQPPYKRPYTGYGSNHLIVNKT